ncbi:aldose 1-epimerase [Azospirillum thermophilum]|uniref:Aldose 1-epimerase n=1 Tax=Azospirillum thermophilum TaxID=2202148 RepID=A0A2S2CRK5_9PROT|nr:aldose 1-epimerase [Azospirillum thermophilum]AWK87118.1 aldose 1-epimerase [Azospirillum thermophilum]
MDRQVEQRADDLATLRHGAIACLLAPDCGGSIARLTVEGPRGPIDLLRPASPAALAGTFAPDMGCFPLVPFSNRIGGGRFTFRQRRVRLETDPGSPHRIHGHGWQNPWMVEGLDGRSARLTYRHGADDWPWRYAAAQDISVERDGLTVSMELVNLSDEPMPAGIGLHPYFPKPPGTVLTANVATVWRNDDTLLPLAREAVPEAWDFPRGVRMDEVVLDNGFTGWDGVATLDLPALGHRLTIAADGPFGHLIVYAPRGESYLCVEPVSHMTDAVNRTEEPDAGLRVLEPGERLAGTVRLRVCPL